MKIGTMTRRSATIVLAIAVFAALSSGAQAATQKGDRASAASYRALALRSEALNQHHRLGKWKNVPTGMTVAQYRALVIRSQALNKHYGLGRWSAPAAVPAPNGSTDGFAWRAFGIGAVTMLGLVLIAAAAYGAIRFTRDAPHVRTS